MIDTLEAAKKLIVLVVGLTIILLGVVMLVTPGPGIVVIIIGLALLATEFIWARRLLRKFKKEVKKDVKFVKKELDKI